MFYNKLGRFLLKEIREDLSKNLDVYFKSG